MSSRTGNLSINSENIFPIIKKWLYSDHDIFYRELVSNGCDAITKLKKLELMGEYSRPEDLEYKIQVTVNPDEKTISVTDNGLGMTILTRLLFPALRISWKNIRIKPMRIRSSAISDWDFILHLWLQIR